MTGFVYAIRLHLVPPAAVWFMAAATWPRESVASFF